MSTPQPAPASAQLVMAFLATGAIALGILTGTLLLVGVGAAGWAWVAWGKWK